MSKSAYTVGLGILSWKAPETLSRSLESYHRQDFFSIFDEKIVYLGDATDQDYSVMKKYRDLGVEYISGPNLGFTKGMKKLAESLQTDFVLFLENDLPLLADHGTSKHLINRGCTLIKKGQIDLLRLRSRTQPGYGFSDVQKYLKYYSAINPVVNISDDLTPRWIVNTNRLLRPIKSRRMRGRSLYVERNPEKLFPAEIKKIEQGIWSVDSSCINWTNQSILFDRTWFLNTIMNYVESHPPKRITDGHFTPEIPLNSRWWRNRHFRVGVSEGIFSHERQDGWRDYSEVRQSTEDGS